MPHQKNGHVSLLRSDREMLARAWALPGRFDRVFSAGRGTRCKGRFALHTEPESPLSKLRARAGGWLRATPGASPPRQNDHSCPIAPNGHGCTGPDTGSTIRGIRHREFRVVQAESCPAFSSRSSSLTCPASPLPRLQPYAAARPPSRSTSRPRPPGRRIRCVPRAFLPECRPPARW